MQTIDRTVEILSSVSASPSGLTLTELTSVLGLPKTTVFRVLQALVRHDLLRKHGRTKVYRLGPALITLGTSAVHQWDLRSIARPHLQRLASETNETVFLAVLYKDAVICLDTLESERSTRFLVVVGRKMEFHASSAAKAILAYQPDDEIARVLQREKLESFTSRTITHIDKLTAHFREVRRKGYALCDGELEVGVRAVAAPILQEECLAVGSIGLVAPSQRLDEEGRKRVVPPLLASARSVSEQLGCNGAWSAIRARTAQALAVQ